MYIRYVWALCSVDTRSISEHFFYEKNLTPPIWAGNAANAAWKEGECSLETMHAIEQGNGLNPGRNSVASRGGTR